MATVKDVIITGGAALALALSLSACGGSTNETGDAGSGAASTAVSHDANLEPELVEPGWLEDANTSDLWWPDGKTGTGEAVYFTHAANDASVEVTFVDADGNESGVWHLEVVDKHLVTKADAPEETRKVDFTFQDNFTCYDAESDTTYMRGDRSQADYNALFEGIAYVEDPANPDKFRTAFDRDGVCTQYQDGYDPLEGTWQVVSTNVVRCHFTTDTSEWDTNYRFTIGEDGTVSELDSGSPIKLQLYEG